MTRKTQRPDVSMVHLSAAEHLTFVAAVGAQQQPVEMRYEGPNIRGPRLDPAAALYIGAAAAGKRWPELERAA